MISEITREKLRIASTGRVFSAERREKLRQAALGNKRGCCRRSPETRQKMSEVAKARRPSEVTKERIRQTLTGRTISLKARLNRKGIFAGEKNIFWRGGIATANKSERQLAMQTIEYKYWRQSVFVRDDYTCQECLERGGKLNADHIQSWAEYPELRYELSNGRTLCESCHRKTDSYGNRNKPYGMATRQKKVKIDNPPPAPKVAAQPATKKAMKK